MTSSADKCGINGCDEKEEVSPRGTGILVLSPLLQPLYVNPSAVMLLRDLARIPPLKHRIQPAISSCFLRYWSTLQ